tara:strand:+ start:226 stop:444 length:219 start_codon:yes stop_codon:yes gene_type:complete
MAKFKVYRIMKSKRSDIKYKSTFSFPKGSVDWMYFANVRKAIKKGKNYPKGTYLVIKDVKNILDKNVEVEKK